MTRTTSNQTRCRACGRQRPMSAVEHALGSHPAAPEDVPAAEPALYAVDPFEQRAIRAAEIPHAEGRESEGRELREALATSLSMTGDEKLATLGALPKFADEQLATLLRILRDEKANFDRLNAQHREKLAKIEAEYAQKCEALPLEAFIPDDVVAGAALSPTDHARLIRQATPPLLRCLGAGDAERVFRAVLERLATQIEAGGETTLCGYLPDVFAPVLRDPLLNPHADAPAKDAAFLDSLVRPSISRLRAADPAVLVRVQSLAYRASLLLSGPERPRGPVRQTYRIGVQLHLHKTHALGASRYRERLTGQFLDLVAKAPYEDVLPLEKFGPLGALAARAVELRGYSSPGSRRALRLQGAFTLLRAILPLLHFEEKAAFLATLLGAEIHPCSGTRRFDDWFLEAVAFPDAPEDEFFDACLALVPMLDEFLFAERLAVLGHLRQLPPRHRDVNTLFVAFRSALATPTRGEESVFESPVVAIDQILAERVLYPDAFVASLERELAAGFAPSDKARADGAAR